MAVRFPSGRAFDRSLIEIMKSIGQSKLNFPEALQRSQGTSWMRSYLQLLFAYPPARIVIEPGMQLPDYPVSLRWRGPRNQKPWQSPSTKYPLECCYRDFSRWNVEMTITEKCRSRNSAQIYPWFVLNRLSNTSLMTKQKSNTSQ